MLARLSRCTLPSLVIIAGLLLYRATLVESPSDVTLDFPRSHPWVIGPRHDEPRMVTDEQLHDILERLQPKSDWRNTNNWVHSLRLWGPRAEFARPQTPSGQEMLDYFLDDRVYRRFTSGSTPSLFTINGNDVTVRSYEDDHAFRMTSSFHQDDLLATLAESGVPLETTIVGRPGETSVARLLTSSLQRFHPDQYEFEWTIISYVRYAFPLASWRNQYGQRIKIADLIDQLLEAPLALGPCNGLHRLEAIVLLYRADQEAGGPLDPKTRHRLLTHMQQASVLLAQSQHADGYWTKNWPRGAEASEQTGHDLGERLLVTGHQLEWLALAPEEVHPPRETLVRAGQWLARTMLEVDDESLQRRYGPFSHAARALSYWRGQEPYDAWRGADALETATSNPAP